MPLYSPSEAVQQLLVLQPLHVSTLVANVKYAAHDWYVVIQHNTELQCTCIPGLPVLVTRMRMHPLVNNNTPQTGHHKFRD